MSSVTDMACTASNWAEPRHAADALKDARG